MPLNVGPKMSVIDRIKLSRGEEVDIYVGPKKKHYLLPKNLLCESSAYFNRYLNSDNFIRGKTDKITLNKDKVQYFELLLEYMFVGKLSPDALAIQNTEEAGMQECIEFIQYATKYDLTGASVAVFDALRKLLTLKTDIYGQEGWVTGTHIKFFFAVFPAGDAFRSLITQAVISHHGIAGLNRYRVQEKEVQGYAEELLLQLRACFERVRYEDPLTKQLMIFDYPSSS